MKISAKGLQLIERHEGCILVAYICPAGVWTIGIGHTRTAKQGLSITRNQAYDLLRSDLEISEEVVKRHLKDLTQHEFDALVSFVFNVGGTAFGQSTLLKKIKGHSPESEIRAEFMKWVHGGGKVLPGLIKRRQDESNLYFS